MEKNQVIFLYPKPASLLLILLLGFLLFYSFISATEK